MKTKEKDKKIDRIILRMAATDKPKADFQQWQQDHPQAVQTLTSCAGGDGNIRSAPAQNIWRTIVNSRITKFATAAAVILIATGIFLRGFNGSTAWAKVMEAFGEIENIHIVRKVIMPDGTVQQSEFWLRRPDCLYQDDDNRIIIDNGKDRLTIDKEKKTAQFSESLMSFRPLEDHFAFEAINLFRGQGRKDIEVVKLDDQSDQTTLVFGLSSKHSTPNPGTVTSEAKGKAWVDAVTMLPRKMQVEFVGTSNADEPVSGEVICEYGPIADDVFAMAIPEGVTELPRKVRGVMSGVVVDENEQPVTGAIVYATDRAGKFSEQTTTDANGQFIVKLPPEGVGWVWLPVLLRAFTEDTPDKVAWSIIKDPASTEEPGGNIPYEVANIENDRSNLKSAHGIILRMEPAGAIGGQVIDADGSPISGAKVQLLRCDLADKHGNAGLFGIDVYKWSGPGDWGIVRTDENGRYELTNLLQLWKNTEVFIHAIAEGFAGDTTSFRLKGPMEYQEVDFQLYQANLTVTGTLIDNYGKPIEEAPVFAMVNGKKFQACNAKTDKNGHFKIKGCPDTSELQIKAESCRNSRAPHEKEKYLSYVYYPDVVVGIDCEQGKNEYEVEMVAERPELILNIEVKNTSGEIIKYFPVEIKDDAGTISLQWQIDKKFTRRTDENGRCRFTEVPNVSGLKLVLFGGNTVWNEKLNENKKIIADENREKYYWAEVPVEIVEGQKEYTIRAVILTNEEYKNKEWRNR
jgi:protocatechuate 3,4-dioxygenase beta subunit